MRYNSLVDILLVSILLMASTKPMWTRQILDKRKAIKANCTADEYQCKVNSKSTKLASKVADEAQAAKDAQQCASDAASREAMNQLAERAEHAAQAAEAALNGKKLLLDQLEESHADIECFLKQLKKLISQQGSVDSVLQINDNLQKFLDYFLSMQKQMMEDMKRVKKVACSARHLMMDRQELLMQLNQRLSKLKKCLKKAKEDLDRTEMSARQAQCAADEASQRIGVVQKLSRQLRKLKKGDLNLIKRVIRKILKK